MKVLAIDSSSVVAGVAVLNQGRLVYEAYHHHKRNHSEILMPMVEEAMESSGLTVGEMDLFAVSSGPGSFTGLRIGISTIKGLAHAVDKPAAAVPTLDALAYNIAHTNALVCPIMDARREQVYTSLYRREGDRYARIMAYSAIPVEKLTEELLSYQEHVLFVGDGIPAYRELLTEKMGGKALFAPPYLAYQRASAVAWLGSKMAQNGDCVSYRDLKPFYLRQSQAEQKRAQQIGGKV
jgi:tRNA threonylcarbamoyladenosine biosynthesis protein TsaB